MELIKDEKIGTEILDQSVWGFDVVSNGIYMIVISARCKGWAQNFRHLFNDDDLAVQIDDYLFGEIKGKKREFSSPGSWNGNELSNRSKTVIFTMPLLAGSHKIKFWVDVKPVVEEIKVYKIANTETDIIKSGAMMSSSFGDCIFKNITVEKFTITAQADIGSNIEIKVDGLVQTNSNYKRYQKWYWYGQELKGTIKDYELANQWDNGLHSIEFSSQGKPDIQSIKLKIDLNNIEYKTGYINLYTDLSLGNVANLRSVPSNEGSEIVAVLKTGDKVGILNERVLGKYIENFTDIWHEVSFGNLRGFVLSSCVEIVGQERGKIIDLIKEECTEYKEDSNIMLAIASQESHFKPYARSYRGPKGIFQLGADAAKDMHVVDQYDFYQNIDGGVRYYKWIEKQVVGRGDVFERRLIAWHDGLGTIKNKKTVDYSKLSEETKTFIKNVKANIDKKDWYHITALSLIILLFATSFLFRWSLLYKSAFAVSTSSTLLTQDSYFINTQDRFPKVVLGDDQKKLFFINSQKKYVGSIEIKKLNLDTVLKTPINFRNALGVNNIFVHDVVLENPTNVFYFSMSNSASCGVSNCTLALYEYDLNQGKLDLISSNIFGEIMGLYISPKLDSLAVVSGVTGGTCSYGDYIKIFNLDTSNEQKISDIKLKDFDSRHVSNLAWLNNQQISFDTDYTSCGSPKETKITWQYDIATRKATMLKKVILEKVIGFVPSAGIEPAITA